MVMCLKQVHNQSSDKGLSVEGKWFVSLQWHAEHRLDCAVFYVPANTV